MAFADFISTDMSKFLLPWYDEIAAAGVSALKLQVGNYNIPYQVCILLMSYLPVPALYAYKLLSIVFDVFLSAGAAFLYGSVSQSRSRVRVFLVFAVVFAMPTVVMDSSAWGQCDSIYGSFALLAIALLLRKKPYCSAVALGLAFAFKLQTVFVIPYFFIWFVCTRERRPRILLLALLVFAGFYLPSVPALFVGRNPLDPIKVYLTQTVYYASMTMNYPNLWGLVGGSYAVFKWPAIALAAALVLAAFVFVRRRDLDVDCPREGYPVLLWTFWAVLFALPAMHDRYGYILTLLFAIASFADKRFASFAIVLELLETVLYLAFFWGDEAVFSVLPLPVLSAVYIVSFICCTVMFVKAPKLFVSHGAHFAPAETNEV